MWMKVIMYHSAPDTYQKQDTIGLRQTIDEHRARLGKRLTILTHHYQRREIVEVGDICGDSYYLSRRAAREKEAEFIVFCGVHFMAEAARILCRPEQRVFLPNVYAGCPMADMAPVRAVQQAWESVSANGSTIPVAYMNTTAALKAFVGDHGGLICTSSNAERAFRWAFKRGERVFFFPDENLGYNTAHRMGIPDEHIAVFDPRDQADRRVKDDARVILWKGYCHVHTNFRPEHIAQVREKHPEVKVVVHPECVPGVVANADAVGSTAFIVNYVAQQPAGSTIAIGTELNLVSRLAYEHPDKTIFELSGHSCSLCVNMFRTTLADLAYTLDFLGQTNEIHVDPDVQRSAHLALERMLELS
jgi:quinolinate synthase